MIPIHDLGPNPHVYRITPMHLQAGANMPDYLRVGLIGMTLAHRLNRAKHDPQYAVLAEELYECRGVMIRSLNEEINAESKRTSDIAIAGIITLLLSDVRSSHIR
jgi:hypothetical protein